MNFPQMLSDLREDMTLDAISASVGLSSKSHVLAVINGLQKNVTYPVGVKIIDLHKKLLRKRARANRHE